MRTTSLSLLCFVFLTGSSANAQTNIKDSYPDQRSKPSARQTPRTSGKTDLRIIINLTDGSRLVGAPSFVKIPIKSGLGEVAIPIDKISTIQWKKNESIAEVNLRNGDRLSGQILPVSLKFSTALGPLTLRVADFASISVTRASVHPVGASLHYTFNQEPEGNFVLDQISGHKAELRGAKWNTEDEHGGVLTFNGKDSMAVIPNIPALNFGTSDFTISVWVKPVSCSGRGQQILWNNYNPEIQLGDDGIIWGVMNVGSCGGVLSRSRMAVGVWSHIVYMRAEGTSKLFINGRLEGSAEASRCDAIPKGPMLLGYESVMREPYLGALDEVCIWNRALSDSEIEILSQQFSTAR